jgi:acyl-CoA thioesterase
MDLPELLAAAAFDGEKLKANIGDEWLQGRTAYGGLSAALALHAVKLAVPDLPPLRSAQIAFVGPLWGDVVITPQLLRRGKSSAFVGCDITNMDGFGLRALFLFMAQRDSAIDHEALAAPPYDGPEAKPIDTAHLPPGFMHQFEGADPGHQPDAGYANWSRLLNRDGLNPEVEFMAIADRLPPAAMRLATGWAPVSTTTWQINMVTDAPSTTDGWWLMRAEALHAQHGSSSQNMTIWNRNGTPMATATQSVALFI